MACSDKKVNMWSRNPATQAAADIRAPGGSSHIFPLPLPGRQMEKKIFLVKSHPEGLQSLPSLVFSLLSPSPLEWICPHRALRAGLAQLWAANTAAHATIHGPEDLSTQGPELIPTLQH